MTRLEQLRSQRLLRHFVHGFFDNELIAAGGEAHQIFVTAIALLGGVGFTLSVGFAWKYSGQMLDKATQVQRMWAGISDNLLVILIVMSLMGLLTVLAWDGLFPTRRDAHVLGALPIKPGEIFRARLYATLLFFFITLTALAVFPNFVLPIAHSGGDSFGMLLRRFAAQTVAVTAAASFVFFGAAALQGILLAILSYGRFLQASSFFQIVWLLSSFALFFLTPNPAVAANHHLDWVVYLPPYWFFGLWQNLEGGTWLYGPAPALAGAISVAALVSLAMILLAVLYRGALRKAVEGLPLSPSGPGIVSRAVQSVLNFTLLRDTRQRAVFWFAARTLARHRSHRLLLAVYIGIGLSWVLAGLSDVLISGVTKRFLAPNPVTCTIPFDLAVILLAGMRVIFTLPVEVRANWLFRTTAPDRDAVLARASRKLMVCVGVLPMAILPAPFYVMAWGWQCALAHTWLYFLMISIVLEYLLLRFYKIPFTCSWLPGRSNMKVRLGVYFVIFGAVTTLFGSIETYFLSKQRWDSLRSFSIFLLIILAWRLWRRYDAGQEPWSFTFEEQPDLEVQPLALN